MCPYSTIYLPLRIRVRMRVRERSIKSAVVRAMWWIRDASLYCVRTLKRTAFRWESGSSPTKRRDERCRHSLIKRSARFPTLSRRSPRCPNLSLCKPSNPADDLKEPLERSSVRKSVNRFVKPSKCRLSSSNWETNGKTKRRGKTKKDDGFTETCVINLLRYLIGTLCDVYFLHIYLYNSDLLNNF